MTALTDIEKVILFDTMRALARWKQVGTTSGYWEIHIWSDHQTFEDALVAEHNKQAEPPSP